MKKPQNCYSDPHCSWLRVAIWLAYDCKDFYKGEPISFREMEIDHIVSQELFKSPDRLVVRLRELGLPENFKKDDLLNFVPTRGGVNVEKYKLEGDQVLLTALLAAQSKKNSIMQRIDQYFLYANAIEDAARITANIVCEEQRRDVIDIILHDTEYFREVTTAIHSDKSCGLTNVFVKSTKNIWMTGYLPEFQNPTPSCTIEFRPLFLRGITISVSGLDILSSFCRGNHTPIDGGQRSYLKKAYGRDAFCWTLANSAFELERYETEELCTIIDEYAEAYTNALMDLERRYDIEDCCLVEGGIRLFKVRQSIYSCVCQFIADNPSYYQNVKMECTQNILNVYSSNGRLHFATRLENAKMLFWSNEAEFWVTLQPYYTEQSKSVDGEELWSPTKVRQWLLEELFVNAIRCSVEKNLPSKILGRCKHNKQIDDVTMGHMNEIKRSVRTLDTKIPLKITSGRELLGAINTLQSHFSLPNAKEYYGMERLRIYDALLVLLECVRLENDSYKYIASNLGNLQIKTKEEMVIFIKHQIVEQKAKRIYSASEIERVLRCLRECMERTSVELGFQTIQKMLLLLSDLIIFYNRDILLSKYMLYKTPKGSVCCN